MSETVDKERAEMSVEFRLERAKRIMRQEQDVLRLWLEGLSVTLIAQRLCCKRDRVYFLLRVLQLCDGAKPGRGVKRPPKPGMGILREMMVPTMEESHGT